MHYNTYVDIPLQTIGDENCVGWFSTQIYYTSLEIVRTYIWAKGTPIHISFEEKFLFSQIVFKFDQSDYLSVGPSIDFFVFIFFLLCAKDERI